MLLTSEKTAFEDNAVSSGMQPICSFRISRPRVPEANQPLPDRNQCTKDQEPGDRLKQESNEPEAQLKQNIPAEGNEVKDSVITAKLASAQLTLSV
jgi:hypothetical protein